MKKIILLMLFQVLSLSSQNKLIGIWNHLEAPYIYYVYVENKLYCIYDYTNHKELKRIRLAKYNYGFYPGHSDTLPSIDSLTIFNNDGGTYYEYILEDNPEDNFITDDRMIYIDEKDDILIIEYTASQQDDIFKRVNILPRHVEDTLKVRDPEIYSDYLKVAKNRGVIKSKKSIIHNDKKNPTKAYLLKGDVIEILERKDKWFRIRFTNNKRKITEGWIKSQDIN